MGRIFTFGWHNHYFSFKKNKQRIPGDFPFGSIAATFSNATTTCNSRKKRKKNWKIQGIIPIWPYLNPFPTQPRPLLTFLKNLGLKIILMFQYYYKRIYCIWFSSLVYLYAVLIKSTTDTTNWLQILPKLDHLSLTSKCLVHVLVWSDLDWLPNCTMRKIIETEKFHIIDRYTS